MKQLHQLAESLMAHVQTTQELSQISAVLEQMSANKQFKQSATEIACDDKLPDAQKKTQLMLLFRRVKQPLLYEFFKQLFTEYQFWLFESESFDYFDDFVKIFQLHVEKVAVIYLVSAIDLKPQDLLDISAEFSDLLGKHAVINLQVNPEIIGGLQVRVDNLIFDYSLKGKLQQFRTKWVASLNQASELVQT